MKTTFYKIFLHSIIIASLFFATKGYGQGYIAASRYIGEGGHSQMFNSKMIVLNGETYILGYMYSISNIASFPITLGSNFSGDYDMTVTKLDTNGVIIWSRFLGGNHDDNMFDLKFHNGFLCVIGVTNSTNYPVTNGSSITGNNYNYFFTKINLNTGIINFSTYLQVANGVGYYNGYLSITNFEQSEIENNVLYIGRTLLDTTSNNLNPVGTSIVKFDLVTNTIVNTFTLSGLYNADFKVDAGVIYGRQYKSK
jgi:hypothetical protein